MLSLEFSHAGCPIALEQKYIRMPNNPWSSDDSFSELESISALTTDLADTHETALHFYRGLAGRRRKAAMVLMAIWGSTIALHLFSWGIWVVWAITTLVGMQVLRMLVAVPRALPDPLTEQDPEQLPFVSLMVAAKNEESVIGSLVRGLCNLNYPAHRYELWVIDDYSTDRTPEILARLQSDFPQLKVFRRSADATGGKSGALNQVVPMTRGEFIGVFDADARVSPDLLRWMLPLFGRDRVGSVQVRKAIAHAETRPHSRNFWIGGQVAEMGVDSFFQRQRIAVGGLGELRGNGQFVRRTALEDCGGWNEETITDDLDLTLRLHLAQWDIEFLADPAVEEEGVTKAIGLWHQRNRWAEGGYQRYLDYWRLLARNRLGTRKTLDMLTFFTVQYLVPQAAVPDLVMAIARNRLPILMPLTTLTVLMTMTGMYAGLRRISASRVPHWRTLFQSLQGALYMLHWIPVIASTTFRISIRPKRLKWVKTAHYGDDDLWLDVSEQVE